jgi:integrase
MLSELHDLDGERPHWIIPRLRTKNKKTEHTVPLSPAAVRLIGEAPAIRYASGRGRLVATAELAMLHS